MPSGHVTGGAPPGTGKDYQAVLLLTRVLGESNGACFFQKIFSINAILVSCSKKALSRNPGLLPLQSLSPAPGAGQGKLRPDYGPQNIKILRQENNMYIAQYNRISKAIVAYQYLIKSIEQ